MSVPVAVGTGEACDQNIGTKGANHAHHVAERDVMSAPLLESLVRIFRIAEIRDPAEALFHSVVTIGCRQLQRAENAQHVEQIASYFVLTTFAAGERHQKGGISFPARLQGQHAAIFVVGMRGGLHQTGRGLQAEEHLLQAGGSGIRGKRIHRTSWVGWGLCQSWLRGVENNCKQEQTEGFKQDSL